MSDFNPPIGYDRIRVVSSFSELMAVSFEAGVNAACWPRVLAGDYGQIVEKLGAGKGITPIGDECLGALQLSDAGRAARDVLIADQEMLRSCDLSPSLDCIYRAPRDSAGGPVCRDVFSWHADSATEPADTFLCSYNEASSEGLRNDEARRRVDLPETRAVLLARFGGGDGADFLEYLNENFYGSPLF